MERTGKRTINTVPVLPRWPWQTIIFVLFLAEPRSYYQMEYTVGGGGGHSITVVDWVCKIFYVNSSCITPSETVNFDIGGLAWFRELVHVAVQQLRRWGDLVCWTLAGKASVFARESAKAPGFLVEKYGKVSTFL